MTGYTTPDSLPYPNDYNAYADVPADVAALANATQAAVNLRNNPPPPAQTTAGIPGQGGFTAAAGTLLTLYGPLVVLRGWFTRAANLTLVDNTEYQVGLLPAGWHPPAEIRTTGGLLVLAGGKSTYTSTQVYIKTNGQVTFRSNVAGTFRAGGDYISYGGIAWGMV